MDVKPTVDDFDAKKANCLTCTQKRSLFCERMKHKGGYVNDAAGHIGGAIYKCVNYEWRYQ